MTKELFQIALNVTEPWFINDLKFIAIIKQIGKYWNDNCCISLKREFNATSSL